MDDKEFNLLDWFDDMFNSPTDDELERQKKDEQQRFDSMSEGF